MASIGELLDRMVVSARSPDQNIGARVSNYTEIEIDFRPGTFDTYDEERLAHQLARLGALTWVAYRRGRTKAYLDSQALSVHDHAEGAGPSGDPHRRRYEQALDQIEGEGVSNSGVVRVDTVGMTQWNVEIEPGAIRRLGENTFRAEITSALNSLINDRQVKIVLLKAQYFDLGIPRKWRDLVAELQGANLR